MGKAIYQPKGAAQEYSFYACNLYNGCSGKCTYCYNRKGITAKILGGDIPTLKKSLHDEETAFAIFGNEMFKNEIKLKKHGLHFNFVSDPFLPETIELNIRCMKLCVWNNIPVKILTKQTWWIDQFLNSLDDDVHTYNKKHLFAFGFTLTGHDELEPGCSPNYDRIKWMEVLSKEGFKIWASIEPIIDIKSSQDVMLRSGDFCDLYKIGLMSGKKYDKHDLDIFIGWVKFVFSDIHIYFKDSLLKQAGINRADLPSNCVDRDFNLFENEPRTKKTANKSRKTGV
jgi:hypothetical protein